MPSENTDETAAQTARLRISKISLALQPPEALDEEKVSPYVARFVAGSQWRPFGCIDGTKGTLFESIRSISPARTNIRNNRSNAA